MLACKQHEQERVRRSNSAPVDGGLIEALKNLLKPFCNPLASDGIPIVAKIAHDYYVGDDRDKERAREKVESFGITDDQILAEAMQLRAGAMVLFVRMDNTALMPSAPFRRNWIAVWKPAATRPVSPRIKIRG